MTALIRPAMPGLQPPRKPFELVVFDCDGVLVDSEVISVRVDQRVLADSFIASIAQPAERLAGPGTTVFSDMRQLPELIAAGIS
jgi:beta-phosphoglucomutase-like phosphatase (HAD superfamily)